MRARARRRHGAALAALWALQAAGLLGALLTDGAWAAVCAVAGLGVPAALLLIFLARTPRIAKAP